MREWFEKYYKSKYLGKCYCKNTLIHNSIEIFIKGQEYDCYIEDKNETYKRIYLYDWVCFWVVYDYKGVLSKQAVRFNVKINLEYNTYNFYDYSYNFYDYFYNDKEVRRMKLKKLSYE